MEKMKNEKREIKNREKNFLLEILLNLLITINVKPPNVSDNYNVYTLL